MKTCRNKRLGFEMRVPEGWALPVRAGLDGLKFKRGPDGKLNIIVDHPAVRPPVAPEEPSFKEREP
jgi:hypothetical protein